MQAPGAWKSGPRDYTPINYASSKRINKDAGAVVGARDETIHTATAAEEVDLRGTSSWGVEV